MSIRALVRAICALLVLGSTCAAQELSEAEVLARFDKESPQARAIRARVSITRAETRAWSLPDNPAVGYTREDAGGPKDDFLLVQQSLPVTGRLGLMRDAGKAAVRASEAGSNFELVRLRGEVRLAFYELLLAQQRAQALEAGISALEEVARILRAREQEGESSRFDRLRAERELADLRADHAAASTLHAQARARLASLLGPGISPESLSVRGSFSLGAALPPRADLLAKALEVRADYAAEGHRLERYAYEQRAAQRRRIPEPILTAGVKTVRTEGHSDSGYVVGLTVPIALFNRGQSESERAKAEYERTEAERLALRQEIEAEVGAAYASAQLSRRMAEEYARELEEKGRELAGAATVAYQEGEQGILELLDAYRVALLSRLRVFELQAAAKKAQVELNRAVGEEVMP